MRRAEDHEKPVPMLPMLSYSHAQRERERERVLRLNTQQYCKTSHEKLCTFEKSKNALHGLQGQTPDHHIRLL